jgi:hypothetical protein
LLGCCPKRLDAKANVMRSAAQGRANVVFMAVPVRLLK